MNQVKNTLKNPTKRQRDIAFVALMLSLPILQFIVFWIVPNFNSILMAFRNPSTDGFTLINFKRFWNLLLEENSPVMPSITNTVILFFCTNFVNLPIVMFLSYVLFKKVPGYKLFRVIFYLPSILGSSVTAALYRYVVSNDGPVEFVLDWLGVEYSKQLGLLGNPETTFLMIVIYCLWTGVGVNMIMLNGAMARIPEEIFESSKIDGVGFWREFFQIVCPLIWPTVTTLLVFGMSGIFTSYGATMLLAPNTPEASTVGWYIVRFTASAGTGVTHEVLNYPAAVGLVFTVVGLPLVLGTKWLCEKVAQNVEY